jgi:ABC-type multidrug transport system permease subunit
LLGIYTFMVHQNLSINIIIIIFGAFVSICMSIILRLYKRQTALNKTL